MRGGEQRVRGVVEEGGAKEDEEDVDDWCGDGGEQ